jgi:MoaA/NifB/PqqE/SkfB family radical SAM enzyme
MNKKTAYSSWKYTHDMDKVSAVRNGELAPPTLVMLYPTNICNHGCKFCAYLSKEGYLYNYTDKKAWLDKKLFLSLPKQFKDAGVRSVELTGGGEPTLHPGFKEFVSKMNRYELKGALVTNGSTMDSEIIELIKDFSWVRFSVNGGTKEDYEKIQKPSNNPRFNQFDEVWNQIEELCLKKSPTNLVGVSFIVSRFYIDDGVFKTETNASSMYEAARRAKEAGADNIRFSLAFTNDKTDTYEDIWPLVDAQMTMAKRDFEDENFTVFTLADERKKDKKTNKGKKPFNKCNYIKFTTVINAEGYLSDCCVVGYLPDHQIGSLYEKSFKDLWFSKKRLEHQNNIKVNSDACQACFMINKNKFLEYLMDTEPLHVDFP